MTEPEEEWTIISRVLVVVSSSEEPAGILIGLEIVNSVVLSLTVKSKPGWKMIASD